MTTQSRKSLKLDQTWRKAKFYSSFEVHHLSLFINAFYLIAVRKTFLSYVLAHLSNQGTFLPNKAFHCEPNSSFSFATSYTPVQSNLKIKFQKTETAQLVHSATQNSLYWRTDQNLFKERNLILVFNRVSMFLCVCIYISMQSLYIHHMCVCICLYTVFL